MTILVGKCCRLLAFNISRVANRQPSGKHDNIFREDSSGRCGRGAAQPEGFYAGAHRSAGGEVISEQLPGTRFLAVDIRREISPLADLCSLFHLFVLFHREKFTLVHSLTPKAGLLTMLAAFLSRVPVRIHIFTGQVWVTRKGFGRSLFKALDRLIAMLAIPVLADSHSQRRFLIVEGVVSENRIQVIADGFICGVEMRYELQPSKDLRRQISINIDLLIPYPFFENFSSLNPEASSSVFSSTNLAATKPSSRFMKYSLSFVATTSFALNAFLRRHLLALTEAHEVTMFVNTAAHPLADDVAHAVQLRHIHISRKITPSQDLPALSQWLRYVREIRPETPHYLTPKAG